MSDVMLHGVLTMPPELWEDSELDKQQRYSRYLEASRRIEDLERELARASKDTERLEWIIKHEASLGTVDPAETHVQWSVPNDACFAWDPKYLIVKTKDAREAIDRAMEAE